MVGLCNKFADQNFLNVEQSASIWAAVNTDDKRATEFNILKMFVLKTFTKGRKNFLPTCNAYFRKNIKIYLII